MSDKAKKLRDQLDAQYEGDQVSSLFAGLTFWQTGRTQGIDIKKHVTIHGGRFEQYGFRRVTHIIATNIATSNQQWRALLGGGLNSRKFHIVTPDWVLDSIREGKRLPEGKYLPDSLKGKISEMFEKRSLTQHPPARLVSPSSTNVSATADVLTLSIKCTVNDPSSALLDLAGELVLLYPSGPPAEHVVLTLILSDHSLTTRSVDLESGIIDGCLHVLKSLSSANISGMRMQLILREGAKAVSVFPQEKVEDELVRAVDELIGEVTGEACDALNDSYNSSALKDILRSVMSKAGMIGLRAVVLDACYGLAAKKRSDRATKILWAVKSLVGNVSGISWKFNEIFGFFNQGKSMVYDEELVGP